MGLSAPRRTKSSTAPFIPDTYKVKGGVRIYQGGIVVLDAGYAKPGVAMLGSVLLTFVLQMAVIYVPFLNQAFSTTPLSLRDLMISLGLSVIVFLAVELFKWIRQRKK